MNLLVGTSGYSYKEWKGPFYPEKLPAKQMLSFYASRFKTVEINNTFYRMPSESTLMGWAEEVGDDFTFVLKASQRITHRKRLKEPREELDYFMRTASILGTRLGPTLFQLPPNLKKDLPRLKDFLDLLPDRWLSTLEFRHPSWFDDDVYEALRSKGVALCVADTDKLDEAPMIATAGWGYLRLRREQYSEAQLAEWAERVAGQPWDRAFVFFKHEDKATGPRLVTEFLNAAGAAD